MYGTYVVNELQACGTLTETCFVKYKVAALGHLMNCYGAYTLLI